MNKFHYMSRPYTIIYVLIILIIICVVFYNTIYRSLFLSNFHKRYENEIIFYSVGRNFTPIISLSGEASIRWTWDDESTDSTTNPIKKYDARRLHTSRLEVIPWEALDMINIGYDAGDGGTSDVPSVVDQKVLAVENLKLVASSLRVWCSSFNRIKELDFSNFTNLEVIECFESKDLISVKLKNTPKLRRVCFENNHLTKLDLSDCQNLKDIRGALNNFHEIVFPENKEDIVHICIRDNYYVTNSRIFNNMSEFSKIAELLISRTNQTDTIRITSTHPSQRVKIRANDNNYTMLDLRGALRNKFNSAEVIMRNNQISEVKIDSCFQLTHLCLNNNKLDSTEVDAILQVINSFATWNGEVDLTDNQPPTNKGLMWKKELENRSWKVIVDSETKTYHSSIDFFSRLIHKLSILILKYSNLFRKS